MKQKYYRKLYLKFKEKYISSEQHIYIVISQTKIESIFLDIPRIPVLLICRTFKSKNSILISCTGAEQHRSGKST